MVTTLLLTVLLLGACLPCVPCLPWGAQAYLPHFESISSLHGSSDASDAVLWRTLATCKAECTRLQQKSMFQNTKGIAYTRSHGLLPHTLALSCVVVVMAAVLHQSWAKLRNHKLLLEQRELLWGQKCKGIQNQAFLLGERAAAIANQHTAATAKNQALEAENADLRQQQAQQQAQDNAHIAALEQAGVMPPAELAPMQLQLTSSLAFTAPLVGENSTPLLEHLVAGAAINDTTACNTDQDLPELLKRTDPAVKQLEFPAIMSSPSKNSSAPMSLKDLVERLNQQLAHHGHTQRLVLHAPPNCATAAPAAITSHSPASSPSFPAGAGLGSQQQHGSGSGSNSTHVSAAAMAAGGVVAGSAEPLLPPASPAAAAGASMFASQQQQPQLYSPSAESKAHSVSLYKDNEFVTHAELKAVLLQKDIETLEEKKEDLTRDFRHLKQEVQLLSAERSSVVVSSALAGSAFVNKTRGSTTPLPFHRQSPLGLTAHVGMSPGFQHMVLSQGGSNSASSTAFSKSLLMPGSLAAPGSAGSCKASPSTVAATAVATPASNSSTSVVTGRAGQLGPMPMQSLEAVGSPSGSQQKSPAALAVSKAADTAKKSVDIAQKKAAANGATAKLCSGG